jgi:hypothetical protein
MKYVFFKILLTFIILFLPSITFGQALKGFFSLSPPVKLWVILHPFAACKASEITEKALATAKSIKDDPRLDGLENGGQADAFRHAYWMALMSQNFNCSKAFRLGRAHERGNIRDFRKGRLEEGELPDSVSIAMDLYNNCVGVHIGFENRKASEIELAEIVIRAILAGEMMIIKRNEQGQFLNCENEVIQHEDWRGIWNNERCLVKSNFPDME